MSSSLWEALGSLEPFPSCARQQQRRLPDKPELRNC